LRGSSRKRVHFAKKRPLHQFLLQIALSPRTKRCARRPIRCSRHLAILRPLACASPSPAASPPPPLRVKANATRTPPSILWSSLDLIEKHSRGLKRRSAPLHRRPPMLPPHLPPPAGSSPQRSAALPNAAASCAEDGCSHHSNPPPRPMPVRAQQRVIKPPPTTTHRRCTTPE
jgi:hypothetical protein